MSEKPTAAFVLSLIGGIFILLVGAAIAALGSVLGGMMTGFGAPAGAANVVVIYGALGVVNGLLVMIFGILLYMRPKSHKAWGVLVLILSLLSWLTTVGGLFIGFILSLIGGILGIIWKPAAPMQPGMQPMPPSMPPQ